MVVGLLSHFLLFVGKGPISNVVQNEKDRHDVRTFLSTFRFEHDLQPYIHVYHIRNLSSFLVVSVR